MQSRQGAERRIADRIVEELFLNGNGDRASRLVLELPDGRDGGGRCRASVREVVRRILTEERGTQHDF